MGTLYLIAVGVVPVKLLAYPVVSKQAGDRWSSAGYLIVSRRLLWSWQSARDKQSQHCCLSLRQHSNFTLNFAAIRHMQKDVSVVEKNTQVVRYILCRAYLCFVAKWPGQPRFFLFEHFHLIQMWRRDFFHFHAILCKVAISQCS